MSSLSPSTRLSLGLAGLTITVLCAAQSLGILPDPTVEALRQRTHLAETIAIAVSQSIGDQENGEVRTETVQDYLDAIVVRNPDLNSAAVVATDDEVTSISAGDHAAHWLAPPSNATENGSTPTNSADQPTDQNQVTVPIYSDNEYWGEVQLRFKPPTSSILGYQIPAVIKTLVFIGAGGFLVHFLFLRRMLKHMDPSQAVPERVRNTLDTLAEGLVVLDSGGHIVLANRAFANLFGVEPDAFQGRPLAEFAWEASGERVGAAALPWTRSLETNEPVLATTLQIKGTKRSSEPLITLLVNSTPVESESNDQHGVIVSFDDITPLESKKKQLAEMLHTVRTSTAEIQRQNEELARLATHDSLTGCINRRKLFELFETEWNAAKRHGHPLACAMIDVDHFKSVNDDHGHVIGDKVLARVAAALQEAARDSDVVARYGGEEFCVLLRHTDIENAFAAAERFRHSIASIELPELSVTASLGVSEISFGAPDPQSLIDQADNALYAAKRSGRNRVVRHDAVPDECDIADRPAAQASDPETSTSGQNIPFHAVTALISALAYRDQDTAAHCRRVADLAVATAEGLLGVSDCYTLEIAALLHDLGKIGVPDQILLKPGKLSDDEWHVMRRHDRIGVEIVRASFAFEPLTTIVSQYRTAFTTGGSELNIGARILAVADAYDSMVSDRPYRKGGSQADAFDELRRCADAQFDPEIVERFISTIKNGRTFIDSKIAVAKETALSIGLQIEHLASALDEQDLDRLGAMATRLRQVAERYHVGPLAERADGLARAVSSDDDLISVLQSVNDLLRVCRSTQTSYINPDMDAAGTSE